MYDLHYSHILGKYSLQLIQAKLAKEATLFVMTELLVNIVMELFQSCLLLERFSFMKKDY